ncbi:cytochrome b/b6 domain-containing protein [Roseococcus sp. SDR]|uniref:cytochrome b n=1 Tax=Roseococcus sp. SDR TaxID=2835532 RepID=UPI001BCF10B5|nr:cytochrome b/b6 domain-containing protein [Roseococcus sp. SDR]MBS7790066.1 cytochrome b [Roseococcus sp. SDR]MBV1845380.1 cytochrome b/b6 domain-containing protein [Roseococcus sp. SDR]
MPKTRHDPLTLGLHWLIALLILGAYATSELAQGRGGPGTNLHGSLGLAVFGLSLIRILWRGFAPHPTPVPMGAWMARAARLAHVALYATMLLAPLLGLAALWARGTEMSFLGLVALPSPMTPDRAFSRTLKGLHELASNALVLLALLHAAAAIFHQYVLRDGLLERMIPRRR